MSGYVTVANEAVELARRYPDCAGGILLLYADADLACWDSFECSVRWLATRLETTTWLVRKILDVLEENGLLQVVHPGDRIRPKTIRIHRPRSLQDQRPQHSPTYPPTSPHASPHTSPHTSDAVPQRISDGGPHTSPHTTAHTSPHTSPHKDPDPFLEDPPLEPPPTPPDGGESVWEEFRTACGPHAPDRLTEERSRAFQKLLEAGAPVVEIAACWRWRCTSRAKLALDLRTGDMRKFARLYEVVRVQAIRAGRGPPTMDAVAEEALNRLRMEPPIENDDDRIARYNALCASIRAEFNGACSAG